MNKEGFDFIQYVIMLFNIFHILLDAPALLVPTKSI